MYRYNNSYYYPFIKYICTQCDLPSKVVRTNSKRNILQQLRQAINQGANYQDQIKTESVLRCVAPPVRVSTHIVGHTDSPNDIASEECSQSVALSVYKPACVSAVKKAICEKLHCTAVQTLFLTLKKASVLLKCPVFSYLWRRNYHFLFFFLNEWRIAFQIHETEDQYEIFRDQSEVLMKM